MSDTNRALSAFNFLDPGVNREIWLEILMAGKAAGITEEDALEWSRHASNFESEKSFKAVWKSISKDGPVTARTLYHLARKQGWCEPRSGVRQTIYSARNNKPVQDEYQASAEVWALCVPATAQESYIVEKQGNPDGIRVYPFSAPLLKIMGHDVRGYLAVPCWDGDVLQTIQFISPNGGYKLNLIGAKFNNGFFTVGEISETGLIYIGEGIGVAWSAYKSTGFAAVSCFSCSRMMHVAKILREKYPLARLVVLPDREMEQKAAQIAAEVDGFWVELPSEKPKNYDANDYAREFGHDGLEELLSHVKAPELPLSVVFADELSHDFMPPDELVEGVLTAGDGSILYGNSNSGKTSLVIDMACAVARGVVWMGYKTEPGLVIYLAAESPASVKRRLQAYQKHYRILVPNFAIVESPIDLFDGDADTQKIIKTVRLLEKKCRQKARLIIGDTLSRLSAGANESAGQDMSLVIRHFDCIRNETGAHFMLIHHCGKNAAAGARGWSGVRAAVDTEIEVTDLLAGRCAEITKQRDLSTKGQIIGFKLDSVTLGKTKWGSPATSCIVMPCDALLNPKSMLRKKPSGKQKIIWEALGPLFKESRIYGRSDAPPEKSCLDFDFAVEQTMVSYPCEKPRQKERTKIAILGLVSSGFLKFKGGWLWAS